MKAHLHNQLVAGEKYTFSVYLWNQIAKGTMEEGHPGIAFNIQDEKNHDIIFFRYMHLNYLPCLEYCIRSCKRYTKIMKVQTKFPF